MSGSLPFQSRTHQNPRNKNCNCVVNVFVFLQPTTVCLLGPWGQQLDWFPVSRWLFTSLRSLNRFGHSRGGKKKSQNKTLLCYKLFALNCLVFPVSPHKKHICSAVFLVLRRKSSFSWCASRFILVFVGFCDSGFLDGPSSVLGEWLSLISSQAAFW